MRIDGEAIAKMRLRRRLEDQGGFTLAEVLVAGLILVVALIPIVRMFDTSFAGIMASSKVHKSVTLGQKVMEEIKSMPFYIPYTGDDTDIDDHFWGARNPANNNPGEGADPDWGDIPEVTLSKYGHGQIATYPDFRVGVKLCYLNDDTTVADMGNSWGPKTTARDRPVNGINKSLNLLLVQVNVYKFVDGVERREHQTEAIITSTEALYNLGVSRITVISPASIIGTADNAAAHWPNTSITVSIEGWGFEPDDLNFKAYLVRPDYNDIEIVINRPLSSDSEIIGSVNLTYNGSQWFNRAPIGFWSVKVKQNVISAYLHNGFICEYPRPLIQDYGNDPNSPYRPASMSKTGYKGWGTLQLRLVGGYFVHAVKNPTVRLIEDVEEEPYIITGEVLSISGGSSGYSSSGCEIIASFDIAEAPLGDYRIEVINTDFEVTGHVSSGLSDSAYRLEETPEWLATIDGFTPNPGYGFYENYYDIPSTITGTDLSGVNMVKILSDGGDEYDISDECVLGGDVQIPVNLNLIDCDNTKSWEIRVYHYSGAYIARGFDVTPGRAMMLELGDPKRPVRIEMYEKNIWGNWVYRSVSEETGADVASFAYARRSTTILWWSAEDRAAIFEVKGMGFPMNGTTRLEIYRGGNVWAGDYNVQTDRTNKLVWIRSNMHIMPNTTWDNGGIKVWNGVGQEHNVQPRWRLRDTW
jgi:hypothetical protein